MPKSLLSLRFVVTSAVGLCNFLAFAASPKPSTVTPSQYFPTYAPIRPTYTPSRTILPTVKPSLLPSQIQTVTPSVHSPSVSPSSAPSAGPSAGPTAAPTRNPSVLPSQSPTVSPSAVPSSTPSVSPSHSPSQAPTGIPTAGPSAGPTTAPTRDPSVLPSLTSSLYSSGGFDEIRFSQPPSIENFNTQLNLLLPVSIRSMKGCEANWTVDNPSLKLNDAAILSITQLVIPTIPTTVYLYLKANALSIATSYQFTIHCGYLNYMIRITTNSPPSNGAFTVDPLSGSELSTQFQYSAFAWVDENLPLSYQFGFNDPGSGLELILQDKSAFNNTHSTLPSGLQASRYTVNATMEVFDSLSASIARIVSLKVTPSEPSALDLFISSQLSNKTSSTSIILIGNIINKVNCSGATHCGKYNRQSCSTVDNTCGECLDGFVGAQGPQNTQCAKINSIATTESSSECFHDADCDVFQLCNTLTSSCYVPSKQCPNSCSSHGTCKYVGTDTGADMDDCILTSSNCRAVCSCNIGFAGSSCSLTTAQIIEKQNQRNMLLLSFNNLPTQNISSELVISRASTLLSITQKSDELGAAAVSTALVAVSNLLQNAVEAQVSYRDLTAVLQSTDSVASAVQDSNTTSQLLDAVSRYGSITASQLIGEQNVVNIFSKFRMSTVGLAKSESNLSVPQTPLESLQPTISSSVHFAQNEFNSIRLKVTVIESSASLLGNSKQFVSNPLIVQISNVNGLNRTESGHEVLVALRRVASLPALPVYNFTSVCRKPRFMSRKIFNYTCPLTGHILTHNCSNKVGKLVSYCPVYKPSCQSLPVTQSSFISICHMVNYTDTLTWCRCTIGFGFTGFGRFATRSNV